MKVFIIDDDPLSIFLSRHKLVHDGLSNDIHSFLSAEEAFQNLTECRKEEIPDIVLLDLNMPVMDGWQFLNALFPLWPRFQEKCRIFILTSSVDLKDIAKVQDYPMVTGYINKPFNTEDGRKLSKAGEKAR